jgi:hypothetical protein
MPSTSATIHAGLLARKGEARPSAPSHHHGPARSGQVATLFAALARREPLAEAAVAETVPLRRIELPRAVVNPHKSLVSRHRRQVHARIEDELHLRLRIAAARGGRTQQDLVASALESYLSFLDEDVYSPPCGASNAGV